mmetsp:Transcript_20234/g.64591  ORF Transcript_20234/g.64591 Transcript_20234/m.64591 type:complete len:358 (+) Transcript_20234:1323-2396(+)
MYSGAAASSSSSAASWSPLGNMAECVSSAASSGWFSTSSRSAADASASPSAPVAPSFLRRNSSVSSLCTLHLHLHVSSSITPPCSHSMGGHMSLQEHVSRLKPLPPQLTPCSASSSSVGHSSHWSPVQWPSHVHEQLSLLNTPPCSHSSSGQVRQLSDGSYGGMHSHVHSCSLKMPSLWHTCGTHLSQDSPAQLPAHLHSHESSSSTPPLEHFLSAGHMQPQLLGSWIMPCGHWRGMHFSHRSPVHGSSHSHEHVSTSNTPVFMHSTTWHARFSRSHDSPSNPGSHTHSARAQYFFPSAHPNEPWMHGRRWQWKPSQPASHSHLLSIATPFSHRFSPTNRPYAWWSPRNLSPHVVPM